MTIKEAVLELKEDLERREYSPKTVKIYCDWIEKINEFYPNKSIESIGQKEISDYLNHLNFRLNTAASTINQAFQSFQYWISIIISDLILPLQQLTNTTIYGIKELTSVK
jgi:site-specific recombinase XerD